MIAISESTPGAMGINMSTYVGYTTIYNEWGNYFLSFIGSIISTLGIVSPAIVVIVIVSLILQKFKNNKYVNYAFYGLRAASVGLIIAAAFSILKISILNGEYVTYNSFKDCMDGVTLKTFLSKINDYINLILDWKALGLAMIFGVLVFKYKKHPIFYIILSAVVGLIFML